MFQRLPILTLAALLCLLASTTLTAAPFIRGDVNQDGEFDLADAVSIFSYLFSGEEAPACLDAADLNDSGGLDISDGIAELSWLFSGGPPPAAPWPECGEDPTRDMLSCARFEECAPPSTCDDCPEPFVCIPIGPGISICSSQLSNCDEIRDLYEYLVRDLGRTCTGEGECQLLWGQCGVGLGGCYHPVNQLVRQEMLSALGERFWMSGCTDAVCDCAQPPEEILCEEDGCAFPPRR